MFVLSYLQIYRLTKLLMVDSRYKVPHRDTKTYVLYDRMVDSMLPNEKVLSCKDVQTFKAWWKYTPIFRRFVGRYLLKIVWRLPSNNWSHSASHKHNNRSWKMYQRCIYCWPLYRSNLISYFSLGIFFFLSGFFILLIKNLMLDWRS